MRQRQRVVNAKDIRRIAGIGFRDGYDVFELFQFVIDFSLAYQKYLVEFQMTKQLGPDKDSMPSNSRWHFVPSLKFLQVSLERLPPN